MSRWMLAGGDKCLGWSPLPLAALAAQPGLPVQCTHTLHPTRPEAAAAAVSDAAAAAAAAAGGTATATAAVSSVVHKSLQVRVSLAASQSESLLTASVYGNDGLDHLGLFDL